MVNIWYESKFCIIFVASLSLFIKKAQETMNISNIKGRIRVRFCFWGIRIWQLSGSDPKLWLMLHHPYCQGCLGTEGSPCRGTGCTRVQTPGTRHPLYTVHNRLGLSFLSFFLTKKYIMSQKSVSLRRQNTCWSLDFKKTFDVRVLV